MVLVVASTNVSGEAAMSSRAAETRFPCAVLHPNDEPIVSQYRHLQRENMLEGVHAGGSDRSTVER